MYETPKGIQYDANKFIVVCLTKGVRDKNMKLKAIIHRAEEGFRATP